MSGAQYGSPAINDNIKKGILFYLFGRANGNDSLVSLSDVLKLSPKRRVTIQLQRRRMENQDVQVDNPCWQGQKPLGEKERSNMLMSALVDMEKEGLIWVTASRARRGVGLVITPAGISAIAEELKANGIEEGALGDVSRSVEGKFGQSNPPTLRELESRLKTAECSDASDSGYSTISGSGATGLGDEIAETWSGTRIHLPRGRTLRRDSKKGGWEIE